MAKLTVKEVAIRLDITPQQVLNRIKRKQLPAEKFGWVWIIEEEDLSLIEETKEAPEGA